MADTEEMKAFVRSIHALKRIAAPEEHARAALFLASDAATFVSAMLVDGGVSIDKTCATTLRTARAKLAEAPNAPRG
jgi:NAD(P)-dependent dehydrogenase (short-subunit alcohol dehydrogenase family)